MNYIITLSILIEIVSGVIYTAKPGPLFPPTRGAIWPKAQREHKRKDYLIYRDAKFHVNIVFHSCDILVTALNRNALTIKTLRIIKLENNGSKSPKSVPNNRLIRKLNVNLMSECEYLPHYYMDESYKLKIQSTSTLSSYSIWGILRGLETFVQLLYLPADFSEIRINITFIEDFPAYKHRGLLIDTARHYLRPITILKIIDAMAMNKLNVLHWHIVDDQSFPYESYTFPNLSKHGAFHSSMVYTQSDVSTIIEFARLRGIRVIPEFDVPGHTASWSGWGPNIVTRCDEINFGPLNPIKNTTYAVLDLLYREINEVFPDRFMHVGGDEVDLKCWMSNPTVERYTEKKNMTVQQLQSQFFNKTLSLIPPTIIPIVWQEVFDENVNLNAETFIHVWKLIWNIEKMLKKGHYILYSSKWYLDHLDKKWEDFYVIDPRRELTSTMKNQSKINFNHIVGGEACMWGELVDDDNVMSRIWPKASAVAERLWSGIDVNDELQVYIETKRRLEEHWCRMKRRGISAQPPSGPGFCVLNTFYY